jgi:hypothetical protein
LISWKKRPSLLPWQGLTGYLLNKKLQWCWHVSLIRMIIIQTLFITYPKIYMW